MRRSRAIILTSTVIGLAACGSSGTPSSPSNGGTNPNQMIISASGVLTPSEITIAAGSRVLFINNHSRSHQIASDPHPEHDACPEINQVGLLGPGQQRETGNFVTTRTCGLHDHNEPDNGSLKGRIIIR